MRPLSTQSQTGGGSQGKSLCRCRESACQTASPPFPTEDTKRPAAVKIADWEQLQTGKHQIDCRRIGASRQNANGRKKQIHAGACQRYAQLGQRRKAGMGPLTNCDAKCCKVYFLYSSTNPCHRQDMSQFM